MSVTLIHPAPAGASRAAPPRLSATQAIAAAVDLAPRLAQRAAQAEAMRRCPQETVDELRDSGLLADRIQAEARAAGVDAKVWVDADRVYLALARREAALYVVVPRAAASQEVK